MANDKQWSSYQTAIFADIASGTGHTAVDAKAGSGKTTTILEGLRHVPRGKGSLFVAFNKSIADELAVRVKQQRVTGVEVSTLHSYGLKAVTRAFGRLRIETRKVEGLAKALVGDARDLWELRSALCKAVSLSKATLASTEEEIDACLDAYELDVPLEAVNKAAFGKVPLGGERAQFVFYVVSLLAQCREINEESDIDFDDMIWLPVVLNLPVMKYDRVFVDETQDLNECQIRLVLGACDRKRGGRILAVGDPHQAIYGFRGAASGAFETVVSRLNAKVMPLSVTYRCARSIVALAQGIVPGLEAAPNAEEGVVRDAMLSECRKMAGPGDFILSRVNAPLVGLCLGFLREGRRAHIQGRDIGKQLQSFVEKAGAATVDALRRHTEQWCEAEVKRLAEKHRDTQSVEDKRDCILTLSEGASSVAEVLARIGRLFADDSDAARITLSTTHKAKGLERDRVWMLDYTYRRRPGVEEDCCAYVAMTRARKELVLVQKGVGE